MAETDLEKVASALDPAMVIVTAAAGERKAGCLVGFHTQVSIDPPRTLVCVSQTNHTHEIAAEAPVLGVHVVPEERRELADLFGGETGDEMDKFELRLDQGAPGRAPARRLPDPVRGADRAQAELRRSHRISAGAD